MDRTIILLDDPFWNKFRRFHPNTYVNNMFPFGRKLIFVPA